MRRSVILYLVLLAVVDVVIPVPLLALLLIYVVARRPAWFRELAREVYSE